MTVTLPSGAIIRALHAAHLHEASSAELLQLACDRLRALGAPYTSVYAYLLRGDELALAALAGRETEHTRIPIRRGVCGTAVATGDDPNGPDVSAVSHYLACNRENQAELVVLIRPGPTILGQLGIDSDTAPGFRG